MTYIDCPVPINNRGLSKIVDFGQVQPLQWENNEHWQDWRNIFSVKAKLLYVKKSCCDCFVMNYVRIRAAVSRSPRTQVSYPLDHVVFWSIVKVFVISVNVLSIVNCKVIVVELYSNRCEKKKLGLIFWSEWSNSDKWQLSNLFPSLLMMIVVSGTRECLHNELR